MMKKYIARQIVMFMKKHGLNVHDSSDHGRDDWMWFYNLFYTEYKDKVKTIPDFEISMTNQKFNFFIELDYSYKGILLDINDLPWFLTRNRYLINMNCKKSWYYFNSKYYFFDEADCLKMKKIFNKTYTVL